MKQVKTIGSTVFDVFSCFKQVFDQKWLRMLRLFCSFFASNTVLIWITLKHHVWKWFTLKHHVLFFESLWNMFEEKTGYYSKPVWKSTLWLKISGSLWGFWNMFETCYVSNMFEHVESFSNMFEKVQEIINWHVKNCLMKCFKHVRNMFENFESLSNMFEKVQEIGNLHIHYCLETCFKHVRNMFDKFLKCQWRELIHELKHVWNMFGSCLGFHL